MQREAVTVAEEIDALAIHVLHDEIRDAVGGGTAIEQACDVAMIEARQNLALGAQAIVICAAHETGPHELHGNVMAVLADALGEVHIAHAATTEAAAQLPGAQHFTRAIRLPEIVGLGTDSTRVMLWASSTRSNASVSFAQAARM